MYLRQTEATIGHQLLQYLYDEIRPLWKSHNRGTMNKIGLACSGGGIRAAAQAYGVLQSIASRGRELGFDLGSVDFISGVSGGGAMSAYCDEQFCVEWSGIAGYAATGLTSWIACSNEEQCAVKNIVKGAATQAKGNMPYVKVSLLRSYGISAIFM